MDIAIEIVKQILIYALGIYMGMRTHALYSDNRIRRRYYRLGIRRGLHFWARVIARDARRRRCSMNEIKQIGAVCGECAHKLGFVPRNKPVGVWMDRCEVCGEERPCTDLWHDWKKVEVIAE